MKPKCAVRAARRDEETHASKEKKGDLQGFVPSF